MLFSMLPCPANAQELGLKMQRELLPHDEVDENAPVFVDADTIRGHPDIEFEAFGDVRFRRQGEAVFADYLRFDVAEQELTASGNLRFERPGAVVNGQGLRYSLVDSTGEMNQVEYFLVDENINAHGKAQRLVAESRDVIRVEDATYTNCEVGDEDWYMRVKTLELSRSRDLGIARHASIVFKGLPILYSPYLDFSLSGKRKSGLLPPSIGQTASSGFEVTLPYYFNIAPNYDATFSPRFLEKRGTQLKGQFRYLEPTLSGEVRAEFLDHDRVRDENRYAFALRHNQQFGANTSGYLTMLGVSDDFYFIDLSEEIAATSLTNLPREGGLSYNGGWWNLTGRVQKFQTLQDPLNPLEPPYERVPQITFVGTRPINKGLDMNITGELVKFEHPNLISGRRDTLYPSFSLPLRNAAFYVTPKLGYHYTRYTFDENAQPEQTRELPIFTVDSGVTFERDTSVFGSKFTQTLEPRLFYVYIPYVDQDTLPNYDSGEAVFDAAQLFWENKFTGGDRINDADEVTAAVTSRFIDPRTGSERLRFIIGQRYYFSQPKVTLNLPPPSANRSDVLLGAGGRLGSAWWIDSFIQYGALDDQIERSNHALRYRPEPGKVINLAYRYTRLLQEQVDMSTQWPVTSNWYALARWNYSLRDAKILEGLAGVEYNSGCWTARIVAHHFVNSVDLYTTSFFLQLELNGVSSLGLNPLDTLYKNISGYSKLN